MSIPQSYGLGQEAQVDWYEAQAILDAPLPPRLKRVRNEFGLSIYGTNGPVVGSLRAARTRVQVAQLDWSSTRIFATVCYRPMVAYCFVGSASLAKDRWVSAQCLKTSHDDIISIILRAIYSMNTFRPPSATISSNLCDNTVAKNKNRPRSASIASTEGLRLTTTHSDI